MHNPAPDLQQFAQRRRSWRGGRRRSQAPQPNLDVRGYAGIMPAAVTTAALPAKLNFFCQLAHGGPTAVIQPPNNLNEVYTAISGQFDGLAKDDILYCTVNTFKVDMDNLLTSNLKLNDFIFAHVRGTKKEVTLTKTSNMLGVTLTDNGDGKVFIKRIHDKSVACKAQPAIQVGDHIEKINGDSVVGKRHFNVAAILRSIPIGQPFTLRLVEPLRSGFSFVAPRSATAARPKAATIEDGTQTLRFKSTGDAVLQEAPSKVVVEKINGAFETYLGFNDDMLALTGWEIAGSAKSFLDLKEKFKDSDLGGFGFPEELLFDIWGIVDDWRKERLPPSEAPSNSSINTPAATTSPAEALTQKPSEKEASEAAPNNNISASKLRQSLDELD